MAPYSCMAIYILKGLAWTQFSWIFTIPWGKYEKKKKNNTRGVWHALKARMFSDKSIFQPQDIWLLCLFLYVYLKELSKTTFHL